MKKMVIFVTILSLSMMLMACGGRGTEEPAEEYDVPVNNTVYTFADDVLYDADGVKITIDAYDAGAGELRYTIESNLKDDEEFAINITPVTYNGLYFDSLASSGKLETVTGKETKSDCFTGITPASLSSYMSKHTTKYPLMCQMLGIADASAFDEIGVAYSVKCTDESDSVHYNDYGDNVYKSFVVSGVNADTCGVKSYYGFPTTVTDTECINLGSGMLKKYYGFNGLGSARLAFDTYVINYNKDEIVIVTSAYTVYNVWSPRNCTTSEKKCSEHHRSEYACPVKLRIMIDGEEAESTSFQMMEDGDTVYHFNVREYRKNNKVFPLKKLKVSLEYATTPMYDYDDEEILRTIELGKF